jgi:hypothetical protein
LAKTWLPSTKLSYYQQKSDNWQKVSYYWQLSIRTEFFSLHQLPSTTFFTIVKLIIVEFVHWQEKLAKAWLLLAKTWLPKILYTLW